MSRQSESGTEFSVPKMPMRAKTRGPTQRRAREGTSRVSAEERAPILPTSAMIRAGRHLVGWSRTDLAERSGLSIPTVERMEEDGPLRRSGPKLDKLRRAFAAAGVTFTRVDGRECICCRGATTQEVASATTAAPPEERMRRSAVVVRRECVIIPFPRRPD